MTVRKALYYLTWPLEALAFAVSALGRPLKFAIIVSNPAFLALYLMSRKEPRRDTTRH